MFTIMRVPSMLSRYIDEFTFRLNEGNVKRHSLERLASFVDAILSASACTYLRLH